MAALLAVSAQTSRKFAVCLEARVTHRLGRRDDKHVATFAPEGPHTETALGGLVKKNLMVRTGLSRKPAARPFRGQVEGRFECPLRDRKRILLQGGCRPLSKRYGDWRTNARDRPSSIAIWDAGLPGPAMKAAD